MKKLLMTIAAAASALGLYAAGEASAIVSEGFENSWEIGGSWSTNCAATVSVEAWDASKPGKGVAPYYFFADGENANVGSKYLSLKTAPKLTDRLTCSFTDEQQGAIGDGIFFDNLVKFTNCDELMALDETDGAKLAVYTFETNQTETTTAVYLYVAAGFYNDGVWETKNYNCGELKYIGTQDPSGWTRVTIRAINDISAGTDVNPGFIVMVNGEIATIQSDDKAQIGNIALNPLAGAWASKNALFPSMFQDQQAVSLAKISSVCFAGQGDIDDVVATRDVIPGLEDNFFTLSADDKVVSYNYSVNGGAKVAATGDEVVSLPLIDMTVTITDLVYVNEEDQYEEYGKGVWTGTGCTVNTEAGTFTVSAVANKPTGQIVSADVAKRITIGGVEYGSFAEAIAAIPALSAGDSVTLQLSKNIKATCDASLGTEAFFQSGEGEIVLDLNGKTITRLGEGSDFIVAGQGLFKIIDSSEGQTGKIVSGADDAGAVIMMSPGHLTIAGGTFDGAVELEDYDEVSATGSIIAGAFEKATNGETEFTLAACVDEDVSVRDDTADYFVVKAIPQIGISVTAPEGATVTIKDGDDNEYEDGDQVTVGKTLYITAELSEVTYDPVITVNKAAYDAEKGYTVAGDAVAIDVAKTPHEFQAIYYDAETLEEITGLTPATFNIENAAGLKPPTAVKDGYKFVAWLADPEDEYSVVEDTVYADFLDGIEEDLPLELYAQFEKLPVVAMIGDDEYTSLGDAVAAANESAGDAEVEIDIATDYAVDSNSNEVIVVSKKIAIDLNGYTLTVPVTTAKTVNRFGTAEGGELTLKDSAETKGKIVTTDFNGYGIWVADGSVINVACRIEQTKANNPVFDIYGGTVNCGDDADIYGASDIFRFKDNNLESTVTITGGKYESIDASDTSRCIFHLYKAGHKANITITGGDFTFKNHLIDAYAEVIKDTNPVEYKDPPILNFAAFDETSAVRFQYTGSADPWVISSGAVAEGKILAEGCEIVADTERPGWFKVAKAAPVNPVIDPTHPTVDVPVTITSKEDALAWAEENVKVATPDDKVVTMDAYTAYFKFTVSGDVAPFTVAAELKDEVLKAEAETAEVLDDVLALTKSDTITVTNAKPGLYYTLKQGNTLEGSEPGVSQMATAAGVELDATKWADAGFYQIIVSKEPLVQGN